MEQIARVRLVRAQGIMLHAVRSSTFRKEEGRLTGSGVDKGKDVLSLSLTLSSTFLPSISSRISPFNAESARREIGPADSRIG